MKVAFPLIILALVLTPLSADGAVAAGSPSREGTEFFEKHVRPVLAEHCYSCHSVASGKTKGGLVLDSRDGVAKGGDNGAVVVAGEPDKSSLVKAVRWADADLQMPPKRKLDAKQIEAIEQWVKMGAPDPRDATQATGPAAGKKIDVEAGKKWWAFQPVAAVDPPAVRDEAWPKKKADRFVLAALEQQKLAPSPQADERTLVQRVSIDLTGLRATYDEVEAYARDPSPDKYEKLVEKLLASPAYGERWGRHWLDVARYGEDNYTGEATTPGYPYAWRYRDWVIKAVNDDVPYDRFVKLQLAADLMPGVDRRDFAALGYLGAAPIYHKDGRLSRDVIETLYSDDWDERVDTVTRGVLGLTVACARCHDHKFDPVTAADYYAIAGVFASTVQVPRPLAADVDPAAEAKFMAAYQRLFYLAYVSNLLRVDPGSKPREAKEKVIRFVDEIVKIKTDLTYLREKQPGMYAILDRVGKLPDTYDGKAWPTAPAATFANRPPGDFNAGGGGTGGRRGGRRGGSSEPFVNAVYDAGVWIDGSDPDLTFPDIRPGDPRDMPVFPGGNVARGGETTPRRFVSVLAKDAEPFKRGSGRLDLAERMFTDSAPLSARVIVNRAWGWHFGKPLVGTPSDFGVQGDKPTHPQLLDDLAARFVANGWSMKWLHREMVLSAAYRQASRPQDDGMAADPTNRLLWRMNPRRLDVEAFRDALLQAAGTLDRTAGGPSPDLDQAENTRRTVYGRIGRGRVSSVLQLFDFPEPTMTSPGRDVTTTPLQQLFVMNSPFVQGQATFLARSVGSEPDEAAKVRAMYRRVLARDATPGEVQKATAFLAAGGSLDDFGHALLTTNEMMFWP